MLHEMPFRYNPPALAAARDGDRKQVWTGQKRQKHKAERAPVKTTPSASSDEMPENVRTTPPDSSEEMSENDIISEEEFEGYLAVLATRKPIMSITPRRMDAEQERKLRERLAFCRIRASMLAKGVSIDELDDATLRKEFSPEALKELYYLDPYEKSNSVDWYFDRRYSMLADLGDYQRLVLKNGHGMQGGSRFLNWKKYSWFTTYEMDEEYLKLFEELSKKIKWIKRYLITCKHSSPELLVKQNIAFRRAVKIAEGFPHMNCDTTFLAYTEHMWNVVFNYANREDHDLLYYEIWKRVTEQKISFEEALKAVHREDMFPRFKDYIQCALDHNEVSDLESNFRTCVEGIPDEAEENGVHELIKGAVWNKLFKPKMYHEYITRKMEIVKHIGLDPQA